MKKKKLNVSVLGNKCLLCRRKATHGLACERHKYQQVDLKYYVSPYVILNLEKEEQLKAKTLYPCARCGYQLLSREEVETHRSIIGSSVSGIIVPAYVCKNPGDCSRRIVDLVAGKKRVAGCAGSLTL